MGKKIEFPNATKEQNKILNKIAEQKKKETEAEAYKLDKEKETKEFLFLWKHFEDRLQKQLKEFRDHYYQTGICSLEVLVKIKKEGSTDNLRENFVYDDKLKLYKIVEIE